MSIDVFVDCVGNKFRALERICLALIFEEASENQLFLFGNCCVTWVMEGPVRHCNQLSDLQYVYSESLC